jgi:hypothetical protein
MTDTIVCTVCGRPLLGEPRGHIITPPTSYHVRCHRRFHEEMWKVANVGKTVAQIREIVAKEIVAKEMEAKA